MLALTLLSAGLLASLFWGSFVLSTLLVVWLALLAWTKWQATQIVLKSLNATQNLKRTSFFQKTPTPENSTWQVFESPQSLQLYHLGPGQMAISTVLLKELSPKELATLLKSASDFFTHSTFKKRLHLVALFLYLGNGLKALDRMLCFVFGLKSEKGEPKTLARRLFSPLLNSLCQLLTPSIRSKVLRTYKKDLCFLEETSYLSLQHPNPLLKPLSLLDSLVLD